ncbi:MAG: hypothetical protein RLZZ151_37 [Pseudomonadota bacterium]|jgi:hypothetical protein
MNETIKLQNGAVLTWDEFCALPEKEQNRITQQLNSQIDKTWSIDVDANRLPTGKELLPRIRAAAERNAIREEDLLAFIKVVHDVFFPPQPTLARVEPGELPGKANRKNVGGAFMQMSKAVITPAGEFDSMAAAGRFYQVEGSRIRSWIKSEKPGFFYK